MNRTFGRQQPIIWKTPVAEESCIYTNTCPPGASLSPWLSVSCNYNLLSNAHDADYAVPTEFRNSLLYLLLVQIQQDGEYRCAFCQDEQNIPLSTLN